MWASICVLAVGSKNISGRASQILCPQPNLIPSSKATLPHKFSNLMSDTVT